MRAAVGPPRRLREEERAVVRRVAGEAEEGEEDVVEGEAGDGAGVEVCDELRVPAWGRKREGERELRGKEEKEVAERRGGAEEEGWEG